MDNIPATQVKVTLPNDLYLLLRNKSERFGLAVASYIRNLVINDVKDVEVPEFRMSKKRENVALKALEDYQSGKTKRLTNIDKYFNGN